MFLVLHRKINTWSKSPYVRFCLWLLLTTILIVSTLSVSGCDEDEEEVGGSTHSKQTEAKKEPAEVVMARPDVTTALGSRDTRYFVMSGGDSSQKIDCIWIPPQGATNFSFWGQQPEPGGPPFVFKDVPGDKEFYVHFNYTTDPEYAGRVQNDTVTASPSGVPPTEENTTESTIATTIKASDSTAARTMPLMTRSPATSLQAQEAYTQVWDLTLYRDITNITMTTDLCNDWLSLFKGDDVFIAVRMPQPTTPPTQAVHSPFVFGAGFTQTLKIKDFSSGDDTVVTMTFESRPERLDFLYNNLPTAEGEYWVALGVGGSTPATCPDGLNLSGEPGLAEWNAEQQLMLDMRHHADNCEHCDVSFYYCYAGQEAPPLQAAARALALFQPAGMRVPLTPHTYQDQAITCVGPEPTALVDISGGTQPAAAIQFGAWDHWNWQSVTPTHQVQVGHTLEATPTANVLLEAAAEGISTTWRFYEEGSCEVRPDWWSVPCPDFTKPITPPVKVGTGWGVDGALSFWTVGEIPADAPSGPTNLYITATLELTPTSFARTWNSLWVGEWVAPPAAPNRAPFAFAGLDQSVALGSDVTLYATGSNDPDGDALSYHWQQTGGATVDLSAADAISPTFTAPDSDSTLSFLLTVTDTGNLTDTDYVVITVGEGATNTPPTISAIDDQTTTIGYPVTATFTISDAETALNDLWLYADSSNHALIYGGLNGTIMLGNGLDIKGSGVTRTLTITPTRGITGTATITVTVNDGDRISYATFVLTVINHPPTADAGQDLSYNPGDTVTLDGSQSSDPDPGDSLTYGWVQTNGDTVTLRDSSAQMPTFTASTTGTLTFQLTVTDTGGLSNSDSTVITITTAAINHAPRFTSDPITTATVGVPYTYTATATDDDDDPLTITLTTAPAWLTLTDHGDGTATLTGTPPASGNAMIELTVTDGEQATDLQRFTLIIEAQQPPGHEVFLPLVLRE